MTDEPACDVCAAPLSEKEIDVCRSAPGRFNQQLLCFEHQRLTSACPAVRGTGLLRR